jgi:hypothetical protein
VAPEVSVEGVTASEPLSGDATITPAAKYPDGRQASRFELYVNGVRVESIGPGGKFTLATKGLADGWHHVRIVAIDNTPVAVQGAWREMVQVKNGADAVELIVAEPKRFSVAGAATVEVASVRTGTVEVKHNGRVVARVSDGKGRVDIDAGLLGKGRVELYAEQAGTPPLRSRPATVEIY